MLFIISTFPGLIVSIFRSSAGVVMSTCRGGCTFFTPVCAVYADILYKKENWMNILFMLIF